MLGKMIFHFFWEQKFIIQDPVSHPRYAFSIFSLKSIHRLWKVSWVLFGVAWQRNSKECQEYEYLKGWIGNCIEIYEPKDRGLIDISEWQQKGEKAVVL